MSLGIEEMERSLGFVVKYVDGRPVEIRYKDREDRTWSSNVRVTQDLQVGGVIRMPGGNYLRVVGREGDHADSHAVYVKRVGKESVDEKLAKPLASFPLDNFTMTGLERMAKATSRSSK